MARNRDFDGVTGAFGAPFSWTRRDALRVIGGGAVGLVSACGRGGEPPAADSATAPAPSAAPAGPVIRTVLADVPVADIGDGAILFHEHLSATTPYPYEPPPEQELPPHFTGDVALITEEVRIAGTEGVSVIVDGGHDDMGRSMEALEQIATGSGVHVVASGGYYTQRAYPPTIAEMSVEEVTDTLVADAMAQRHGAFGEIGTSGEITPDERKVLTAIARAHVRTGLPIFTHNAYAGPRTLDIVPTDAALRQLDLLEAEGVDLNHLVIGHLCCLDEPSAETAIALARRGVYVGWDRVGFEVILEDEKRVAMAMKMLEAGVADKLMLASDFYLKSELKSEGGPGFALTLTQFVPKLQEAGFDDQIIRQITVENPRRWLAFTPRAV